MQKMHLRPFGELTALPRPLAGFWGPFLRLGWESEGRKGEGKETEEKETEGEGRVRDGRKGKGREERRWRGEDGRGGEGPLRLRLPGSLFYPSPPLVIVPYYICLLYTSDAADE